MTTSVTGIQAAIVQRQPEANDDDGSVPGNNADLRANHACGRVFQGPGHQPEFGLGARRVPVQEDDGLGKPKFSLPIFEGSTDVEEYLTWELKMEKLWGLDDYTEDRKIKLASSEFDAYALHWLDGIMTEIRETNGTPIRKWREMKETMKAHFLPTNYLRIVFEDERRC